MSKKSRREKKADIKGSRKGLVGLVLAGALATSAIAYHKTGFTPIDSYSTTSGRLIETQGNAQVIFIPQAHPITRSIQARSDYDTRSVKDISSICIDLYDSYGARALILEGLLPEHENQYRVYKKLNTDVGAGSDFYPFVNKREWALVACESEDIRLRQRELEAPVQNLRAEFREEFRRYMESVLEEMYKRQGDRFVRKDEAEVQAINARVAVRTLEMQDRYNKGIRAYLNEHQAEFKMLSIDTREEGVVNACKRAIGFGQRVVVVYGAAHTNSLKMRFEQSNLSYCIIEPNSLGNSYTREFEWEGFCRNYNVTAQKFSANLTMTFNEAGKAHVDFKD